MSLKRTRPATPPQPRVTQIWPHTGEKPAPEPELVLMNGAPTRTRKEITGVTNTTDYVVREPFRIVVDGTVYTGGDSLTLPDDDKTKFWRRARWIEPAPVEEKVAAQ